MGTSVAGGQGNGRRGWRRHLTVNNVFFVAMLLVVGFGLARRQGIFLDSPSVEGRPPDERSVIAPDFSLPSLAGAPVRLSDNHGKVVLVNFWATWCPPCRAEMPSMERLYQAYRDRGLVILAISSDVGGKPVVEPYVQERGLTFPILLDPEGEVFSQYGVRGLPPVTSWTAVAESIVPTWEPATGPARQRGRSRSVSLQRSRSFESG